MVNMGGDSPKAALSFLRNALGGSRIIHELGIATPPWPQTERTVDKKERAIDAAARKFYQACVEKSLPAPTFKSHILFLLRQKLYVARRQTFTADYEFFRDKAYYYDTNIHPLKAAAAKVVVRIMLHLMKNKGPGNIHWPAEREEYDIEP